MTATIQYQRVYLNAFGDGLNLGVTDVLVSSLGPSATLEHVGPGTIFFKKWEKLQVYLNNFWRIQSVKTVLLFNTSEMWKWNKQKPYQKHHGTESVLKGGRRIN